MNKMTDDVDKTKASPERDLLKHAKYGNYDEMKKVLDRPTDPNCIPEVELERQGLSALHLAVRHNHPKCVKLLLESAANVNIVDNFGFRPVHDACLYGHLEILKLLLKHGARTDGVDRVGLSSIDPLFYAAQQNHIECLQVLFQKAKISDAVLWDLSSKRGNTELLKFISNKDIPDEKLQKWLQNSALTGHANFFTRAKEILKRNLNQQEANVASLTAVQHGKVSYVRLLLESGVDPNLSDGAKFTALHHAARYGQYECIEELVKAGADINALTLENWTPLHIAVRQSQGEAARKLVDMGCNVNAVGGSYDETPLHLAAAIGDIQMLKILLKAYPDLLAVNKMGKNVMEMNLNSNVRSLITKHAKS